MQASPAALLHLPMAAQLDPADLYYSTEAMLGANEVVGLADLFK